MGHQIILWIALTICFFAGAITMVAIFRQPKNDEVGPLSFRESEQRLSKKNKVDLDQESIDLLIALNSKERVENAVREYGGLDKAIAGIWAKYDKLYKEREGRRFIINDELDRYESILRGLLATKRNNERNIVQYTNEAIEQYGGLQQALNNVSNLYAKMKTHKEERDRTMALHCAGKIRVNWKWDAIEKFDKEYNKIRLTLQGLQKLSKG